jgi:hypothetical protein
VLSPRSEASACDVLHAMLICHHAHTAPSIGASRAKRSTSTHADADDDSNRDRRVGTVSEDHVGDSESVSETEVLGALPDDERERLIYLVC